MIKRAKTAEQYIEMINQAIFEIEELRLASDYDADSLGSADSFLDELEEAVREIRKSMEAGTYSFGKANLPYMKVVETADSRLLPFKYLLKQINETHKHGLDVDD